MFSRTQEKIRKEALFRLRNQAEKLEQSDCKKLEVPTSVETDDDILERLQDLLIERHASEARRLKVEG